MQVISLSFPIKLSSKLYINYLNSLTEESQKINFENIIKYIFENKIISTIFIGSPTQKMNIFFNNEENSFYLSKDPEINNDEFFIDKNIQDRFSFFLSSTFILKEQVKYEQRRHSTVHLGQEEISFDDQSKILFQFLIENDSKNQPKYFGVIGIGLDKEGELLNYPKFINQLYYNKIINNCYWNIDYEENKIVIGEENIIPNNKDYVEIITKPFFDIYSDLSIRDWNIFFSEVDIYYKNEKKLILQNDISNSQGSLDIDFGFIIGIPKYREFLNENLFNSLSNNNVCSQHRYVSKNKYKSNYYLYYCNKTFESEIKEKFQSLKYISKEFNFTFELNYDDLFVNINNNHSLLFMVIFEVIDERTINYDRWILGQPFLKKYKFIFNPRKKTIALKKNITHFNNCRNNINFIFLKIVCIIFILVIMLFLLFKFINKYKMTFQNGIISINKKIYPNKSKKNDINKSSFDNNIEQELELKDPMIFNNDMKKENKF